MPKQALVEALGALLQCCERHRAGGESDPCADRGEVVEVVVKTLHLQQQSARPGGREAAPQTQHGFGCLSIGDRIGDGAGAAGPLCVGNGLLQGHALGRLLQPPVLVEEAEIQEQDPLADGVEAEVPGLDHSGMDRSLPPPHAPPHR